MECGRFGLLSWADWKRFFHLLLVAATAAVIASCGPPNPGMPELPELPPLGDVTAAAPVVGEPIADAGTLRNLLLTGTDLPPNFTVVPEVPARVKAPADPPTDPAECAKVLTPLAVQRPGALAQAVIQYQSYSSSIYIDAASYPNEAVAQAFAEGQATERRCTHYLRHSVDVRGNDITYNYRVGGLAQPPAGDAATAFQVRVRDDSGSAVRYLVAVVQVGSTLTKVGVTAQESVDERVLSDLTAALARRLQSVSGP
ncbi:hypothetical protein [Nocardia suismassiliense]|uniref:hypothetical protein n=1 Tax=Nocardia suismassiliense TaxID=2077092 RepID=UPI001F27828A|nr:hypothetical protein [Nocardia suismassiliense]